MPLTSLPIELKLRIPRFCLVTDAAFIDFTVRYKGPKIVYKRPKDEQRGQDKVALGTFRTNRLYWIKGSGILWQENTFIYNLHRFPRIKELQPRIRSGLHMAVLCHLTLRQTGLVADESIVMERVLPLICLVVHRHSSLRALQLDFVHASRVHSGRFSRDSKDPWMFQSNDIKASKCLRDLRA